MDSNLLVKKLCAFLLANNISDQKLEKISGVCENMRVFNNKQRAHLMTTNSELKAQIRDLAPNVARARIKEYCIPKLYAEILDAVCVERMQNMQAICYLESEKHICMSESQFKRNLAMALNMYRKAEASAELCK